MESDAGSQSADPRAPRSVALLSLALVGSAALPWTPSGESFLSLLLDAFSGHLLEGLLTLVGFGSPFLFGLAVVIGVVLLPPGTAKKVVRVPIAFMHSQLLLVALVIFFAGDAVASAALLGFAAVSGVRLAFHTASRTASGPGPSFVWYVRWGAMVIAAVGAWAELQRIDGVALGWGLHVALGSALLIVATLGFTVVAEPARPASDEPAVGD